MRRFSFLIFSLLILCAGCTGNGSSLTYDGEAYGTGSTYGSDGNGTAGASAGGAGGSSILVSAETLWNYSNTGNVQAIVTLLTAANGTGSNFPVVFSGTELGLPAGGSVTLSVTGNAYAYEETVGADADGMVRFAVPYIPVGTEIEVCLTVKDAGGAVVYAGSKTQLVESVSNNIAVVLTGGLSPLPPAPAPVPEDFVLVESNGTIASFYICEHEVTVEEYKMHCDTTTTRGNDYPIEWISWCDAIVYCNLRSIAENLTPVYSKGGSTNPAAWSGITTGSGGKLCGPSSPIDPSWETFDVNSTANGYRLPTEAEWVYAAKGGHNPQPASWRYSGSDTIGTVAWYANNSSPTGAYIDNQSHLVKRKQANTIGLYDMSGNVEEWCFDQVGTNKHSVCGGGHADEATWCEISRTSSSLTGQRGKGFRVCRNVE